MPDDRTAQLEYAPIAPWHRRHRRVRRAAGVTLLLALAAALGWYRKPIIARAQLLYHQRQCTAFAASPDQLVYVNYDPASAAALLAKAGGFEPSPPPQTPSPTPPSEAAFCPPCLTRWQADAGLAWPTGFSGAIVFLHERTSRLGVRRLVAVNYRPLIASPAVYAPFDLTPEVYQPASLLGAPLRLPPTANRMAPLSLPMSLAQPPPQLRFYAGQVDPADPAHFTIRYEMDEAPPSPPGPESVPSATPRSLPAGTIDGRLSDDGARVSFSVRDGPATPPSPWGTPVLPDP